MTIAELEQAAMNLEQQPGGPEISEDQSLEFIRQRLENRRAALIAAATYGAGINANPTNGQFHDTQVVELAGVLERWLHGDDE